MEKESKCLQCYNSVLVHNCRYICSNCGFEAR